MREKIFEYVKRNMAQSRIIHLDREEHRLHIPFSSEPVRLTSDFESEVISLARYMESVARLQKCSEGCQNCYMYYLDSLRDKDGSEIYRTKAGFKYPLSKYRDGTYKVKSGEMIRVCMTSDFFWKKLIHGVMKRGLS